MISSETAVISALMFFYAFFETAFFDVDYRWDFNPGKVSYESFKNVQKEFGNIKNLTALLSTFNWGCGECGAGTITSADTQ